MRTSTIASSFTASRSTSCTSAGEANPLPLLLTHGWPWTFWDFADVIGPLADPQTHGGEAIDAFDLVIPSLPGIAFSNPLPRGVGVLETADMWLTLMTEVLGYERFAAHGGDWGAIISGRLGHLAPDKVVGVHLSTAAIASVNRHALVRADYLPDELDHWERMQAASGVLASHLAVQSHEPQTLAFALADSPSGLAAWLVDRRRNGSDCDGDVESAFTRDELLTMVMLYWSTDSIASSMRYYLESARTAPWGSDADIPYIRAPTAIATGPSDVVYIPRRVAERHANLQRWTDLPRGGHFLAAEAPELVVSDLREFLRPLR
jgi:pimeloyl-ACP methyl ester carboxylesterase